MDKTNTIIKPLVQQHARDAAFYWSQINENDFSPVVTNDKLRHFEHQLYAHLDGLLVAENVGREEAFKELKRWKTQGEAFTCGYLALLSGDENYFDNVQKLIYQSPVTTLNGYESALSFLPFEVVSRHLESLLLSSESSEIAVALGGFAFHKQPVSNELLQSFLHHDDTMVKVAACSYIRELKLSYYLPDLYRLNQNENLLVKHASATALGWLDIQNSSIEDVFQQSIQSYLNAVAPKGLAGLLHHKALEGLVRLAGQVYSTQGRDCSSVLELLPSYLKVLFLGHYGRTDYLPFLLDVLEDEEIGQLAFWAIHVLTGLDLDDATLLLPAETNELADKPIMKRSMQLSIGIRKPNAEAVREACQNISLPNEPLLLGDTISEQLCLDVLNQGRQVERYVASWHLARLNPQIERIDIRRVRGNGSNAMLTRK